MIPSFAKMFSHTRDYHYLNVPRLETFTVYGTHACNLKCLRNPSCLSVNLAATEIASDEKIWCELLSSEKYLKVAYVNSLAVP